MPSPAPPPNRAPENPADSAGTLLNQRRLGPALELLRGKRLRIRLALGFFLLAATPGIGGGARRMVFYAALVFVSLLMHELGHALCGLSFGSRVTVVLHVLGSHTTIAPRLSRWRDVIVTSAGPAASLGSALLLSGLRWALPNQSWLDVAVFVNLAWGLVNLLPVLPFDGGRVLLTLLGEKQRSIALLISACLALVVALEGLLVFHNALLLFLFGVATCSSFMAWAKQRRIEIEQALSLPEQLAEARALLAQGESERARQIATRVGVRAHANATANAAWEIVAWAQLDLGGVQEAYATLGRIEPRADVPSYALAAVEAARGQTRRAIGLLERGRAGHELGVGALKLLIDLHAQIGAIERACDVARGALLQLDVDDTRRVIEAALEANAFAPATELAGELFAITGSPDDAVSQAYGLARLGDRTSARRIFRQLVTLLSNWKMHKATLARLRDLATRPDFSEIIGPELRQLVLAPTPA